LGKTALIEMIGRSLELTTHRYMPGTPFEDLIGYPLLDPKKKVVEIYPTDISIMKVEFPFFDELSRCDGKRQAQILDVLDARTINGRPLQQIRQVWASANPPTTEFTGVQPLDLSVAKRFALALPFPKYGEMDEESRYQLLSQELRPYPELRDVVTAIEAHYLETGADFSDYIVGVTTKIDKLIEVDKRKLMFLKRMLRALESLRRTFGLPTPLHKMIEPILPLCFPEHLAGWTVPLDAITEAHREHRHHLACEEYPADPTASGDPLDALDALPPCERLLRTVGATDAPLHHRMLIFEEVWETLDELDKSCLAVALFPFLFRDPRLSTANVRLRISESLYKIATAPRRLWSFGGGDRAQHAFEITGTIQQLAQTAAGRYAVKIAYYLQFESLPQLVDIHHRLEQMMDLAANILEGSAHELDTVLVDD
jgi:hypothetical protein